MQNPAQLSGRLFAAFIALCFVLGFTGVFQAQIVAFGASNVAGKGVSPNEEWPVQLENLLRAKSYNVHVKNAGISGDMTSHMLKRIDSAIPDGAKILILGGGFSTQQSRHSARTGQADMKAIVARIKSRGLTLVPELTSTIPTNCKQPDRIHLIADSHRLFAERLLPKVISALGGSHAA
jgi:acyl-CoA thioesterase I